MRKWINLFEELRPNPEILAWLGASRIKHVVYHGTKNDIEGDLRTTNGMLFFAEDPVVASSFAGHDPWGDGEQLAGGKVFPAFIRLINPYVPSDPEEYCDYTRLESRADELRQLGHDGFVCNSDGGEQFCVFSADQVRTAL